MGVLSHRQVLCVAAACCMTCGFLKMLWSLRPPVVNSPRHSVSEVRLLPISSKPLPQATSNTGREKAIIYKRAVPSPHDVFAREPQKSGIELYSETPDPSPTDPSTYDVAPTPSLRIRIDPQTLRAAGGVGSQAREQLRSVAPLSPARRFENSVALAQTPDCLSTEALRHAPPDILGVGVSGLLVVPTWIGAGAKGKCAIP